MKVLIIGLGSIGKKHVQALKSLYPNVEIFALRSKTDADKYFDVINIFKLEDIASIIVDFVIIANPTSEHKKTIIQLIEYELPLFIEKPIYSSLDIKEIVSEITKKGFLTYVACNLRFLDSIVFIKNKLSQLQNIKLNEVNVYCGSYLPNWRPKVDFRKAYSSLVELGGGVHIDLIHELDYIYWLFGTPNEVKRNFRSQSSLSIPVFDYANYILDFNGFCTSVVLNYYRRDPKRSLELVFDNETWVVDLLTNMITCNNQIVFKSDQRISDTYTIQMDYFINCVNEKTNTFNSIIDAFNVLKICLDK